MQRRDKKYDTSTKMAPTIGNLGYLRWKLLIIVFAAVTTALEIDIYRYGNVSGNGNSNMSDSVDLYKYMNAEYYSVIKVGKPAKNFKVTFDLTWSDSWLPSQHCGFTQVSCLMHTRYDSSKSSTYQEDGRPYDRANEEVSLSGFLSMDNFYLDHLEVMNQTFVEITKMSNRPFIMNKADGVIGLAFSSLAIQGTVPFFYNLVKQTAMLPVFTFYMNRDETTERAGKLLFGATERSHAKGPLTILRVTEPKYWTVHMDRIIAYSPKKNYTFCANGCNAIFDTGSNQIIGPAAEIEKINNMLQAKEISPAWPYRYMVNCREFAKLPHISFVLNGQDHIIESKYYIQHLTWLGFTMCLSPFTKGTDDSWTLGGAFLMQFYSEFYPINGTIIIAETVL